MKNIVVKLTYWVDGILPDGTVSTKESTEEIPLEALLAMGSTLQGVSIQCALSVLYTEFMAVLAEGVNVYRIDKSEDEEDASNENVFNMNFNSSSNNDELDLDPRLAVIKKWGDVK